MENIGQQLKQRVALYLSCRKLINLDILSRSDPQAEVYIFDRISNTWKLVGKTEVVQNNLNPDFSTFIQCDYYFEKEQRIKVMVYDIDGTEKKDYIGKCETTLGKMFGSNRQTFVADLFDDKSEQSRGKIIIRLDNLNLSNDEIRMKLSAKLAPFKFLCCNGDNNPFYVISKAREIIESGNDFVKVYQSPHIVNNCNPIWNHQKIKLGFLCSGDKTLPIKFGVYSYDSTKEQQDFYGEVKTNIATLQEQSQKQFTLQKGNNKTGSTLTFDQFSIVEIPSFMEYLRSGWAINLSLAIDFTASNGELSDISSLHKQDPTGATLNQYEQALLAVGRVLEPYAFNQQFACFGFGGIPRYMGINSVSHCFNLNGQPNPQIYGLNNVFSAYKNAINQTGLGGPTYFTNILKALLHYIQSCIQLQIYHVMLILTDGEIHDFKETIDMIVELSRYPVSLIIVGVGNESFEKMQFLDSDDKVLRNSKGETAQRDIVQFVKFQNYMNNDIQVLAEEVLREMPEQIEGYMAQQGIKPIKQEWLDVNEAAQAASGVNIIVQP